MVPTLVRVGSTLKGLIEDKLDKEGSKINLTLYMSKATLDAIGLVGENYITIYFDSCRTLRYTFQN